VCIWRRQVWNKTLLSTLFCTSLSCPSRYTFSQCGILHERTENSHSLAHTRNHLPTSTPHPPHPSTHRPRLPRPHTRAHKHTHRIVVHAECILCRVAHQWHLHITCPITHRIAYCITHRITYHPDVTTQRRAYPHVKHPEQRCPPMACAHIHFCMYICTRKYTFTCAIHTHCAPTASAYETYLDIQMSRCITHMHCAPRACAVGNIDGRLAYIQ